jgi:hypothetical protein
MRVRAALFALVVAGLSAPLNAQTFDPVQRHLETEVWPILRKYQSCASRHLIAMAAEDPGGSFEDHELALRPACGAHIETVKVRLLGMGYSGQWAEAEIRSYYDSVRPALIASYQEGIRVAAERRAREEDAALERARHAILDDLDEAYRTCIRRVIRAVVPFSDERAEVLTEAVTAKCMDFEQKRARYLQALFDIPRERAIEAVERAVTNEKRRVLADIVVFRASIARHQAERRAEPDATGSIVGRPAKF